MKTMNKIASVLLLVFSLSFFPAPGVEGGSSRGDDGGHFKTEDVVKFSKKVEKAMAEKRAEVAIVARVGRPREKLPEGMSYTHTAFAVYSTITTNDGRQIPGYAMYNLYQRTKEPDVSDLVQDYPADFFAGVEVLEAGVIIPSSKMQKRLLKVIMSPTYKKLHNPRYSIIANPFTLDFQNCTEHTLDVVFAAIYDTDKIKVIKSNEKAYFEAQPVKVNSVKLALGSLFASDVKISDHPGRPVTATFEAIGRFLKKYDPSTELLTVMPDGNT